MIDCDQCGEPVLIKNTYRLGKDILCEDCWAEKVDEPYEDVIQAWNEADEFVVTQDPAYYPEDNASP